MATKSIEIQVEVDAKDATKALADVDKGVAKIESTAKSTGDAVVVYDKQVQTLIQSKQAATSAVDIFGKSIASITETLKANAAQTQDVFEWVNRAGQGWRSYGETAKDALTALKGVFTTARESLNTFAEGVGLTAGQLGLLGSAGVIAGTALASWKIGEWIGNVTGLTKAIETWASATGKAALSTEIMFARQDTIDKAVLLGAPFWINYADAVNFVNLKFAELGQQEPSVVATFIAFQKGIDDALAKRQQAKELADYFRELPGFVAGGTPDLTDQTALQTKAYEQLGQELDRAQLAQGKYRAEVTQTVKADRDQVTVLESLIPGLVVGTDEYNQVRDAIGGMIAKGQIVPDFLKNWYEANKPVLEVSKDFSGVMAAMPNVLSQTADSLHNLTSYTNEFHGGLNAAGNEIATVTIPMFSALGKTAPVAAAEIKKAGEDVGASWGDRLETALGGSIKVLHSARTEFTDIAATAITGAKGIVDAWKNAHDIFGVVVAGVSTAVSLFAKLFSDPEKQINPVREAFVQLNGGLAALNEKAHEAGVTLTALLDAKNPEQYKAAIDALTAAFDFQANAMKTLNDTVAKYGFTIDELGPAFAAQKLSEQAGTLLQDYQVLTAAGVDHVAIINRLSPAMQDYVTEVLKSGVAIPESMKPVLQSFIDAGALTDLAGNKMTDLSNLTFTETLDKKFSDLIDTINKLTDAISRGLGTAIASIPTNVDVHVGYTYDPYQPPDTGPAMAASGGLVTNAGVQYLAGGGRVLSWRPRGTDTVPAMLTPGEGVVSRTGMRSLGRDGLSALNSGRAVGGGLTVSIGDITVGDTLSPGEAGDKIGKIIAREIRKRGKRVA